MLREIGPPQRTKFLPGISVASPPVAATVSSFNRLVISSPQPSFGTIKAILPGVIDPPVTPEERLADAMAAFGLLCERTVEYLDLLRWEEPFSVDVPGPRG
jgi:hypothetical protein